MLDVVMRKDVDDLCKSLTYLIEVVDGLTRKIGSTLGKGEVESHRRWRGHGVQSNQCHGKEPVWSSSLSEEEWEQDLKDEQQQ